MIVFLGGKNSSFINQLANYSSRIKGKEVLIISSTELLNEIKLDPHFLNKDTKFIIGFCNKSSKIESINKSKEILNNTISMLKSNNIDGNQIYLFGSESHLSNYYEYCETSVKKALLRDQYALDSLLKRNLLQSNFPNLIIINVPGIKKKRMFLKKLLRVLYLYFVAKCHSFKYTSDIKSMSVDEVAEKIFSNKEDENEHILNNLEGKLKISRSWILNYVPIKLLKFNSSIIKHNIDKNIISLSIKNQNLKNK